MADQPAGRSRGRARGRSRGPGAQAPQPGAPPAAQPPKKPPSDVGSSTASSSSTSAPGVGRAGARGKPAVPATELPRQMQSLSIRSGKRIRFPPLSSHFFRVDYYY